MFNIPDDNNIGDATCWQLLLKAGGTASEPKASYVETLLQLINSDNEQDGDIIHNNNESSILSYNSTGPWLLL